MKLKFWITGLVFGAAAACGGSTPDPPTGPSPAPTTSFQATVAGSGGQSGTLSVTIQAQVAAASRSSFEWPFVVTLHAQTSTVTATGMWRLLGGSSISLAGTFDPSTRALNLSGGGFTLGATISGAVITGTYTGPNGATGGLSGQNSTSAPVTVYCGSTSRGGVFNLTVSAGGVVSGVFFVGEFGHITGQVTGNSITITHADASSTGTISSGTVSGTSTTGNTWSGSTSACP